VSDADQAERELLGLSAAWVPAGRETGFRVSPTRPGTRFASFSVAPAPAEPAAAPGALTPAGGREMLLLGACGHAGPA
jgi:hypothetical protein